MLPRGAYAPVPTPLDDRLEFDPLALRRHLDWLASQGLDGALILGTNGEFPSMSLAERLQIAETAAAANSGLQLMLGVGSCSLVEVLEMARTAAALAYQAILCPPPFYFRAAPVAGLAAFLGELLDHAELPVLLYHIPAVTGIPISDELLDRIDSHQSLGGVKDSSGDRDELARLSRRFEDRVYMVGTDRLVAACAEVGGSGSISAAASVAPGFVQRAEGGGEPQRQLLSLRILLESHGLGPSVKAILRRSGVGTYATRPPLLGLDPGLEEELWQAYCDIVPPDDRCDDSTFSRFDL